MTRCPVAPFVGLGKVEHGLAQYGSSLVCSTKCLGVDSIPRGAFAGFPS
jgi:hypothetical protein